MQDRLKSRSVTLAEDSDGDGTEILTKNHCGPALFKPRTGACVHCKSLKVRCEFAPSNPKTCFRCQSCGIDCVPRSRKKRKPAPTHEDLQERAHDQDSQIQALLLQFDRIKGANKIQEWVARAQADAGWKVERSRGEPSKFGWDRSSNPPEMAVVSYFSPDTSKTPLNPPDIVKHCSLYPEDITELFSIYFDSVNPFFSILDPELHTPAKLIWTSPFLFTVICAVASRYYPAKPGLYHLALDFARDAAGKELVGGQKSIDICQAYLLLAVYPVPTKKWAQDRSWLFMGVAIRMAIELELNQPPPPDCDEREAHNRIRTWLNCYCVDASHAIQFGKMPMLSLDDYMSKTVSLDWYRKPMTIAYDVHLCAYVQVIVIMAGWRALISEGNLTQRIQEGFDIVAAAIATEEKLSNELSLWVSRYAEEYTFNPLLICAYRGNTTQMIVAYLRLTVLSVGFQYAFKSGISRESEILKRSIDAATTVMQIMIERLYPTGHLRYAMGAHFLYVSFAAAYLLNLLRPKFLPLLDEDTQDEIITTVSRLIEILSSKEVALDGRHAPALYARFLTSLLSKYDIRPRSSHPIHDGIYAQYGPNRRLTPPNIYSWPDIMQAGGYNENSSPSSPGMVYQQSGDADMDLSLNHFIKSVSQGHSSTYEFSSGEIPSNPSSGLVYHSNSAVWPSHRSYGDWRR